MNLGDFFNDEIRKEYAERQIDIGKALLIKIFDFNVNYPKYCVVVAYYEIGRASCRERV